MPDIQLNSQTTPTSLVLIRTLILYIYIHTYTYVYVNKFTPTCIYLHYPHTPPHTHHTPHTRHTLHTPHIPHTPHTPYTPHSSHPTQTDPNLEEHQRTLITTAAEKLDKAKMIRFVQHTGNLHSTDLGRTASHYYIKYASMEIFNELLKPYMNEGQALAMVSKSEEFEQVKVRS